MTKIQRIHDPPTLISRTETDCKISWKRITGGVGTFERAGIGTTFSGFGYDGYWGPRIWNAVESREGGVTGVAVEGLAEEPEGRGLEGDVEGVLEEFEAGDRGV